MGNGETAQNAKPDRIAADNNGHVFNLQAETV